MKARNDNFVSITCVDNELVKSTANCNKEWRRDPLEGIEPDALTTEYYKLRDVVFAEPLERPLSDCSLQNDDNNMTFIENVTVQKTAGKKNRKYHIAVKDADVPTCPQPTCQKLFSSMTLMKAHIRKVHCAVNEYTCERCGMGFSAEYLLKRHRIVHSGEKIECPVCKKMLSGRTSLSVHSRSHSNTRSHKCNMCKKSFIRKATLTVHVKFVHRQGDLECEKCEARFKSRLEWTRHKSSHRHK